MQIGQAKGGKSLEKIKIFRSCQVRTNGQGVPNCADESEKDDRVQVLKQLPVWHKKSCIEDDGWQQIVAADRMLLCINFDSACKE